MARPASFTARWIVGNPVYVLSAAVMMYGIALLLNRPGSAPGDVPHILQAYTALQLYEAALIGLAAWILLRLLVPEDGVTLLLVESLFLGGAFITLDELLAANTPVGLGLAGAGLALAAVKLGLARRPMGLQVDRLIRVLVLALLALPIAWVPWMKAVVDTPIMVAWVAYAAWVSLAVGLLAVLLLAGWNVLRVRPGPAAAATLVLGPVTLLTVGCHFFSLHHAFLAPAQAWYPVPALIVLAGFGVWAALTASPGNFARDAVIVWLPVVPLVLFGFDWPLKRAPWADLPTLLQPFQLTRWWIVLVYATLLLLTRRRMLVLPFAAACLFAAGQRRQVALEFASDHRGWCLVGLAFALLVLGGWLSVFKHRRRARAAEAPEPLAA
jgi:hypothetical protein